MTTTAYLVPGRSCGTCNACCIHLAIPGEGIAKSAGEPCRFLTETAGCSIYAKRPNVCRTYNCLWRSLDGLEEDWRPDKSGILMQLKEVPTHEDEPAEVGIILIGAPEIVVSDRFAGVVGGFIESGTNLHLMLRSEPGMLAPSMLLNPILAEAIAARQLRDVKALILLAYRKLLETAPQPVGSVSSLS